ncbi:uncharacterized protein At5g01610-like [Apium graveolens]|uniref:uncharacterized protein At5g01610-like n=1 Tax=Apium graveolens TaxID=4045 RepID=UPI003D7B7B7A
MIHQLKKHNTTLFLTIFIASTLLLVVKASPLQSTTRSIYDILKLYGLPMGLLPKGVKDFSFDDSSGRFEVHLDQACNAKFENELHYDQNISGNLSYGEINGLNGILAQDLFLWFAVKEIRVDVPSSGLIYFDVGVVSKQFSLSSFETPRDCLAVQSSAVQHLHIFDETAFIKQPVTSAYKTSSENFSYQLGYKGLALATL